MTRKPQTAAPSGKTILCVDDQIEFLESLRATLEREGHKVLTASDGPSGLAHLESDRIDVLLLDYFMPGMAAEEVIAGIRDPALEVVLLTGYASERPPREMLDRLNIQGYCDKSRGPEEILLWVAVALRHGAAMRKLEATTSGLKQVLSVCLRPDDRLTLETELDTLANEAAHILGLDGIFAALAPTPSPQIPPCRLEEESSFEPPEADELVIKAGRGRWTVGETLASQVSPETARSIVELGRDEGGELADGAAVLPLRAEGRWLGCLWANPAPVAGSPEEDILAFFAGQISYRCIVRQGSTIDPVTGVQSRQFWRQLALRELRQGFRFGHSTGLIQISLTELHDLRTRDPRKADAVLELFGRHLRNTVRGTDLAGRGDHDELLLLVSHTNLDGTGALARLISHRLEELEPPFQVSPASMSFRIGAAALETHGFPSDTLPKPMPMNYYSLALGLLQARAAGSPDPVSGHPDSVVLRNPEVEWPDPKVVAAARRSRSNFTA